MDKVFQSVAFVKQTDGSQSKMLLSWRDNAKRLEFIVADRLEKESFRESVTREVAWQLGLDRKTDFLVSSMAQLTMEYFETQPDESQLHIGVAFYNVHIYRQPILEKLTQESSNRWVSAAEICQGETSDGLTIHPRVVAWVNKWSIVQPWQ